jgi:predicted O-methyltransferase YrrM
MFQKILSGSDLRKSRFHDHKGQSVSFRRALLHAPQALGGAILRVAAGRRPELPWISYDAIAALDAFLTPEKSVLEFGSGMSTIWYAMRAGKVLSVENSRPWYDQVSSILDQRKLTNVDYRFASSAEDYVRPLEVGVGYDLIMVDGSMRDRCTEGALDLLKPGGIFYLDNSDRAAFPGSDEARAAELALDYARAHRCKVEYLTDFAPTQFFAQEGMMVTRPPA